MGVLCVENIVIEVKYINIDVYYAALMCLSKLNYWLLLIKPRMKN